MIEAIGKLRELLSPHEQRRVLLLLVMSIFLAGAEAIRAASIVPFVAVLSDPSVVQTNAYLAKIYQVLNFESTKAFLSFLGFIFFVIVLGTLAINAITTWVTDRFIAMRSARLSRNLFEVYLERPYAWFLNRHGADLGKTVLWESGQVVSGILSPIMKLITQAAIAVALIGVLLVADPLLTIIISIALGGGYSLVYLLSRKILSRLGEQQRDANRRRFQISGDAFNGIKDVKVLGLENMFVRRFEKPAKRFAMNQAASGLIGQLPQYGLQALAFLVMLLIIWYQTVFRGSFNDALPIIALYTLAGYRMMPAFQTIYMSLTKLRYSKPVLDGFHRDVTEQSTALAIAKTTKELPLGLKRQLDLNGITYLYPGSSTPAVQDLNFSISAFETVGIVGQTGAGKTTLVDLILGLLEPKSGQMSVDGVTIDAANRRAWQRSVGYVPQEIFLADDTLAANIAFGTAPNDIDMAAVERSARIANLHNFITSELDYGYQTNIGERGVRLSGGQRQRVGIARALYHDPDLLIMDEGTSALDNVTERAVMDAVDELGSRKTIIMIAHRLTTVKNCDTILLLDKGRLTARGSYKELTENDEGFRALVYGSADHIRTGT